jgi:O-antigen ligase/Flp pilus assembly protein TadD
MRHSLGIETGLQLAITICVVALVVVTTLGGSGGAAWVFLTYRTLLPLIAILCFIGSRQADLRICPYFLAAVCGLIALMLISVLRIPGSHFEGFYLWYKHTFFICAFISLANYARYQSARWRGLILGSVIVVGIVHTIPDLLLNRTFAGFSRNNPNYFATLLLIGLAGSLAVAVFGIRIKWRLAAGFSAAFLLLCILLTNSRGGTLAAGAAVFIAAIRAGNRIPRQVWMLLGLVLLVTMVVASPFLVSKFLDRGERDPYNYARTQIWLNTLPVIAEHPILGTGFGQFVHASNRFAFPIEGQVARYLKRSRMAHSEYLQHIAEIGIPASLLMFSIFGYLLMLAWKRANRAWPEYRCFQEAAILTAVGVGLHGFVDNCWTIPVMASGLVVFSLADLLPLRKKTVVRTWSPLRVAAATALGALVYAHSVVIPGIALAYNDAGHSAFQKSDLESAERLHLASLRFVPDHPLFLDNLGMVYMQKSMDTRTPALLVLAEEYFSQAIAASPKSLDPHIHTETALIRSLNGNADHDDAVYHRIIKNNTELLELDPFIPGPRTNLAIAFYNLGRREEAIKEVQQALEYEPNYVPGYLQIAKWYAEMGNAAEADRYRAAAFRIVHKYRDYRTTDPYVGILLARPQESWAPLGPKPH